MSSEARLKRLGFSHLKGDDLIRELDKRLAQHAARNKELERERQERIAARRKKQRT